MLEVIKLTLIVAGTLIAIPLALSFASHLAMVLVRMFCELILAIGWLIRAPLRLLSATIIIVRRLRAR